MGVPQARWMVYLMENPKLKWMMQSGTPIDGNPQGVMDSLVPGRDPTK